VLYKIRYTQTCLEMLRQIQQPQRRAILDRIGQLKTDPEKQGNALLGSLAGHRSLPVSRYRVVYRVVREEVQVFMLAVGLRREGDKEDVYELAKKLIRNFLVP
jgi:mRNA interferase RelE/StbE